jgi:hypothetical protein
MGRVKGVFFTFGGFFLAMLIIVLSLLVASTLHQSNVRLAESGSLERMYVLDTSLERVMRDLDNGVTGTMYWQVLGGDTLFWISENLDEEFSEYNSEFFSEMERLENFIESDQSEIEFDLSLINNGNEKLPLYIEPSAFEYTHLNEDGKTILTIQPTAYIAQEIFELNLTNVTVNPLDAIDWSTSNPGEDLTLNITIHDESGYTTSIEEGLNRSKINVFEINNDMTLTIGELCEACVQVNRKNTNLTITFKGYFDYSGELLTFNYPQGLYTMNFSDIGIFVNATPRLV